MAFIEQRITNESNSARPLRGPYLAQLELIRRLRHRGCREEQRLGKACSQDAAKGGGLLGEGAKNEMSSLSTLGLQQLM